MEMRITDDEYGKIQKKLQKKQAKDKRSNAPFGDKWYNIVDKKKQHRPNIENLVTTDKLDKKARGRQRDCYLDSLIKCHKQGKNTDLIEKSDNCERWRTITAHIYQHGC